MRYLFCAHPIRFLRYLYKVWGIEHFKCELCGRVITKRKSNV